MFQKRSENILGIVWMCFGTLKASEYIILVQGGIFRQKHTNQAKFSSKMLFSAWKNDIFDFLAKKTPQDASKCNSELGNRQNTFEIT